MYGRMELENMSYLQRLASSVVSAGEWMIEPTMVDPDDFMGSESGYLLSLRIFSSVVLELETSEIEVGWPSESHGEIETKVEARISKSLVPGLNITGAASLEETLDVAREGLQRYARTILAELDA